MADFSKQWCEINDPEMPHDFDIMEEFNKLPPDHYIAMICEGFGFGAIANFDGECYLLIPHNDPTSEIEHKWKKYSDVVE